MPTLYAVSIDAEEQWDWASGWPSHPHTVDNVRVLPEFQDLCAKRGAETTWYANGPVMEHPSSRATMLELASRPGVELGMHIHPWVTPPHDAGAECSARESFLHNHPAERIEAKLSHVYALFERAGVRPRSFRGGRYSSGRPIHDFLRARGFIADASVVPFTTWPDDGAPDYRERDLSPRRLGTNVDGHGFWELPLTVGFTRRNLRRWAAVFNWIKHSRLLRRLRLIGALGRLGIVRRVWLNFDSTGTHDMLALLRVLRPLNVPYILFTVHSSSLVVGGNPYSATAEQVRRIWATADEVLAAMRSWDDARPATVAGVAESLEAAYQRTGRAPVLLT